MNEKYVPTGIEAAVCEDIGRRQQLGIHKYGRTVADNPLSLLQWLKHAYEESLDLPIYLKRAMAELETIMAQPVTVSAEAMALIEKAMPEIAKMPMVPADTQHPLIQMISSLVAQRDSLLAQRVDQAKDAQRLHDLVALCGFLENYSDRIVYLFHDRGTRQALLKVGMNTYFADDADFRAVIDKAIAGEFGK